MKPGRALAAWREKRGLSQTEAAGLLNPPVSQSAWSEWETESKPPNLTNAFDLERLTDGAVKASAWAKPRPRQRAKAHPSKPPPRGSRTGTDG